MPELSGVILAAFGRNEARGWIRLTAGDGVCQSAVVTRPEMRQYGGGGAPKLRWWWRTSQTSGFRGSFLASHSGARVDGVAGCVVGDETDTVEVTARQAGV